MNEQLKDLYTSKWEEISNMLQSFNEEDPEDYENMATHPLLIKADEEYEYADLKVMFFGKETNSWYGAFEEGIDIDSVISFYDEFYLKKGYERYGKPFWNFIRKLKSTQSNKKIGYIWNNVLKIGKSESGSPQQGLINYTIESFNVIPQEIEILKPNILLFLSGHDYEKHIKKSVGNFTKVPIEGFDPNKLCLLKFDDINVDLAIRTYHPGYFQRFRELRIEITDKINELIENQN
jgi:hypothetical protein